MKMLTLSGNVAQNAVVKDINGTQYLAFAVYDTRKKADGTYENAYFDVLSRNVKMQPYIIKGKPLVVIGDLSLRAYIDKQGQPKAGATIMADRLDFAPLDKTGNAEQPQQAQQPHSQQPAYMQYQQQPYQQGAQIGTPAVPVGAQQDLPF